MADSIGTMAVKITGDVRGLAGAVSKAKAEVSSLAKTKIPSFNLGGMLGGGDGIGGSILAGLGLGGGIGAGMMITSTISSITGSIKELNAEAWKIKDQSGDLGMSTSMFQAISESARRAGEDMNLVGQSVGKLQKTIGDAFSGDAAAVKTLGSLGLNADDLIGMNTDQQLQAVAKAIQKIENPAMRTRAEMQLFGESGKKLDAVLKDLAGDMNKFNASVISAKAIEGMAGASEAARQGWNGLKTAIGEVWGQMLYGIGFGQTLAEHAKKQADENKRAAEEMKKQNEEQAKLKARQDAIAGRMTFLDQLKRDREKTLAGTDDLEFERRKLLEQMRPTETPEVYARNKKHLEDEIAKARELGTFKEQQRKADAERASLAADMKSALEATATPQEKLAKQAERIARAQQAGMINAEEAAKIMKRNQADMRGSAGRDMPGAQVLGTSEEYESRIRSMMDAQQRIDSGRGDDAAGRAAKAGEESAGYLRDIKSRLDRMADTGTALPVWQGGRG